MKVPKEKRSGGPPIPPGGKALQRLRQFEEQRGLEPAGGEPPKPKPARTPKRGKGSEKSR